MHLHLKVFTKRFLQGICMGSADLVPGVSGGTVALLMGFYQTFIGSVSDLFSKKREERVKAISFLLSLGTGVLGSVLFLSRAIDACLQNSLIRPLLFSIFFGFICASTVFCLSQVRKNTTFKSISFFLVAAIALFCSLRGDLLFKKSTYSVPYRVQSPLDVAVNYSSFEKVLLGMTKQQVAFMLETKKISKETLVKEESSGKFIQARHFARSLHFFDPQMFIAGILSACAMLLPGISGSTILMGVGLYPLLIGALSDLSKGEIELASLIILTNFSAGVVIGVLFFSKFVRFLFEKWHDYLLVVASGIIVGTLPIIWPFWKLKQVIDPTRLSKGLITENKSLYLPEAEAFSFLCFGLMAISAFIVYSLSKVKPGGSSKGEEVYTTSSKARPQASAVTPARGRFFS